MLESWKTSSLDRTHLAWMEMYQVSFYRKKQKIGAGSVGNQYRGAEISPINEQKMLSNNENWNFSENT